MYWFMIMEYLLKMQLSMLSTIQTNPVTKKYLGAEIINLDNYRIQKYNRYNAKENNNDNN